MLVKTQDEHQLLRSQKQSSFGLRPAQKRKRKVNRKPSPGLVLFQHRTAGAGRHARQRVFHTRRRLV